MLWLMAQLHNHKQFYPAMFGDVPSLPTVAFLPCPYLLTLWPVIFFVM
jgi:hypothetical protein